MKEIQLTQGKFALVDDEDFEWLNRWKWCVDKGGNTFYAQRRLSTIGGKCHKIKMHHAILGKPPKSFEVDHCDGNGLNNQRKNLRFVTRRQNQQNQRNGRKKSSQYPGVYWDKRDKKWIARIQINGKSNNLGYFVDEFEAFESYRKAVNVINTTVIDYD